MHKPLLLLLLLCATVGCGPLPVERDVSLDELPMPGFVITPDRERGGEAVSIYADQNLVEGPCHRLPTATRLTVNGEVLERRTRGERALSREGYLACRLPGFTGPQRPSDEARSEFILSDGATRMRAVFLNLRAPRSVRVNGQARDAVLRAGQEVDLEWFPATDRLGWRSSMLVHLQAEGSSSFTIHDTRVRDNHLLFTPDPLPPGRYTLRMSATAYPGVEACEGFISCEAPLPLEGPSAVSTTVVIE